MVKIIRTALHLQTGKAVNVSGGNPSNPDTHVPLSRWYICDYEDSKDKVTIFLLLHYVQLILLQDHSTCTCSTQDSKEAAST
jgi:hypothetical protein